MYHPDRQVSPMPKFPDRDVFPSLSLFSDQEVDEARGMKLIQKQVDFLASHMQKQLIEHERALTCTNRVFEELLQNMDILAHFFQEAFEARESQAGRVFFSCDADRSLGILNILWHAISFTVRGNTRPMALFRTGREPLFTGRILALSGDFQDPSSPLYNIHYPDILQHEVASLYLPADPTAPAVMKIKHLGAEELYFHQADAARSFLLKTIEIVCGGGFFHET